jgi:hypothetical protein
MRCHCVVAALLGSLGPWGVRAKRETSGGRMALPPAVGSACSAGGEIRGVASGEEWRVGWRVAGVHTVCLHHRERAVSGGGQHIMTWCLESGRGRLTVRANGEAREWRPAVDVRQLSAKCLMHFPRVACAIGMQGGGGEAHRRIETAMSRDSEKRRSESTASKR